MAEQHSEKKMSRRRFIRNSGYVAGGLVGGGIIGGLIGSNMNNEQESTNTKGEHQATGYLQAPLYFTNPEMFAVLVAASERIFPSDDNGPGADELGVAYYIDHALAGAWGNNAREYMQGPFFPGSNFQGYQSPLKRNEVFDTGIKALQRIANEQHEMNFPDLEAEQQDAILTSFQKDEVELKGVTAKTFFNILRAATIEGAYADPAYGGNIDMAGWKMKNFPGHQMTYYDKIESEEFMEIAPQALHSYTK